MYMYMCRQVYSTAFDFSPLQIQTYEPFIMNLESMCVGCMCVVVYERMQLKREERSREVSTPPIVHLYTHIHLLFGPEGDFSK